MVDLVVGDVVARHRRAERFAALGDPTRLLIAEALALTDLSPTELQRVAGIPSNLLTHHLSVLEAAGLVSRHPSAADARRKYVRLEQAAIAGLLETPVLEAGRILFVCHHNSARSPLAAAIWNQQSPIPAESAGVKPAPHVHQAAVRVARRHGIDISGVQPRPYAAVTISPDVVVTVCDIAHESDPQVAAPIRLHWSLPDPVDGRSQASFDTAWRQISERITALLTALAPASGAA